MNEVQSPSRKQGRTQAKEGGGKGKILEPGRNCWRREYAGRAAVIVDAADYYAAFKSAASQAEKTIYIAAWDIDSHTALGREGDDERLGDFINRIARDNPGLRVHILTWDFSVIYIMEREILPLFNLGWKTHRRVRFRMDAEHPVGASQHQKVVVIDDSLAFCGGIDITRDRWDTPEHRPDDPRRTDPKNQRYRPFHDVQMVVDGEAARALGDLFRDRWLRATGKVLEKKAPSGARPWPRNITPDLNGVDVGIARTLPAYKGYPKALEVRRFYEDAIASARGFLYIENQYLTSRAVARALSESLRLEEGPEVVLVLPQESSGWLEQSTMDNLRLHILRHLHQMDHKRRLRVYHPVLESEDVLPVVHSKVMVVDDRILCVGSANLSNRSMGLDSECVLILEAGEDVRVREAAAAFRNRLLGEHLGVNSGQVSAEFERTGSLIRTIEALRGEGRSLRPLRAGEDSRGYELELIRDIPFVDPERPAAVEEMMDQFLTEEASSGHPLRKFFAALALLFILAGLWRFTPLGDWLTRERLVGLAGSFKEFAGMPLGLILFYVAGSLLVVPVSLLHALAGALFPFPAGFLYALLGSLLGAVETYFLGAVLGKDLVRRIGGKRMNRISRKLVHKGWVTVLVVRNLPVAPFSVVNMIAGVSRISFRDFLVGTVLGMTPGILLITIFSKRLFEFIENPNWLNLAVAAGVAVFLGGALWWVKWRLTRNH